jgi:type IV fimbrial biogenesis protein FimT
MHDPVNHLSPHGHSWTPPLTHRTACPGGRRAIGGFTLIELLVTIVVLSILLGLAVPSFRSFMQNDQQWTQTNNLILSLNAARSEAIKNDTTFNSAAIPIPGGAQICTSSDGVACTQTPWNQGWIVRGADPASPQNPKTLQVVGPLPAGTTLTEASDNRSITYLSNGALNTAPGALVNQAGPVAFKMCDVRGAAFARYLQVSRMGRVVAAPTAGQDLNSPPAPLTCP